jgi:hypothetical protein
MTSLLLLVFGGTASAQVRTDVVRLANGDVFTGEVTKLDRRGCRELREQRTPRPALAVASGR